MRISLSYKFHWRFRHLDLIVTFNAIITRLSSDYYASKAKKAHKKKEISIQARNALKFARSLAQRIHCAYWAISSFIFLLVCAPDAKHPPIATYLLKILGLRDRTECIQKSQTWLPSRRDEHHEVIAELSRGGPFRGCLQSN